MGWTARPGKSGLTTYYWYPGTKQDWVRAGVALGSGGSTFALVGMVGGDTLLAAVLGASLTAAIGGYAIGRRDSRALREFVTFRSADTGRAVWRALVTGAGAAGAALFVAAMAPRGWWADGALPLVPALVGAVAHQVGMLAERSADLAQADLARIKAQHLRPDHAAEPRAAQTLEKTMGSTRRDRPGT